jgi:hypothetical protein
MATARFDGRDAREELMNGLTAATLIATLAVSAPVFSQQKASGADKDSDVNTVTGCVSAKPDKDGYYTFTQTGNGSRFRLTGKSMREWSGRPVEIVSAKGKGLSVRGGLVPSTNVAAQAGHIDPAQASIAAQPGALTGKGEDLPEFRVNRVRAAQASCK